MIYPRESITTPVPMPLTLRPVSAPGAWPGTAAIVFSPRMLTTESRAPSTALTIGVILSSEAGAISNHAIDRIIAAMTNAALLRNEHIGRAVRWSMGRLSQLLSVWPRSLPFGCRTRDNPSAGLSIPRHRKRTSGSSVPYNPYLDYWKRHRKKLPIPPDIILHNLEIMGKILYLAANLCIDRP